MANWHGTPIPSSSRIPHRWCPMRYTCSGQDMFGEDQRLPKETKNKIVTWLIVTMTSLFLLIIAILAWRFR
jgi:hypothetical protein